MRIWGGALVVSAFCWLAACGAAQSSCQSDPISGSPRCGDTSGGPEDALITGGAATGLWAAGGCKMNGCEPPFVCEKVSQRCERMSCGESADCPSGYACDMTDQRCR